MGHHVIKGRTQQEQRSKISSTATESYWTGSTRRKRAIADFPSARQPRKFCAVTSLAAIFGEKNGEVNSIDVAELPVLTMCAGVRGISDYFPDDVRRFLIFPQPDET